MQKNGSLSYIVCGAKVDEGDRRTVAIIAFRPTEPVKLLAQNSVADQALPYAERTQQKLHRASDGTFDRIFEYTLFNRTLPDGKHPVWVYYQSGSKTVRVEMPSMNMCVVTPDSERDLGVIKSRNYDSIKKGSEDWKFGIEIWKAAFARYMIVGKAIAC
jgi:hypothetical protein